MTTCMRTCLASRSCACCLPAAGRLSLLHSTTPSASLRGDPQPTPLPPAFPDDQHNTTQHTHHNRRKQSDGRLDKQPFGRAVFRTTSAHANSFEALICFAAAAFTAHLAGLDAQVASSLCSLFLGCRLVYILLYIAGTHWAVGVARSLVWVAGFASTLRLFSLALAQMGL